jgi:hypothetical protein
MDLVTGREPLLARIIGPGQNIWHIECWVFINGRMPGSRRDFSLNRKIFEAGARFLPS